MSSGCSSARVGGRVATGGVERTDMTSPSTAAGARVGGPSGEGRDTDQERAARYSAIRDMTSSPTWSGWPALYGGSGSYST